MRIVVHTTKRARLHNGTLAALATTRLKHFVVCPYNERSEYVEAFPNAVVTSCPQPIADKGLPSVQQWIATMKPWGKLCMIDDDIKFAKRTPGTRNITTPTGPDLERMFAEIELGLDLYPHAGIIANKTLGIDPDVTTLSDDCGPLRSLLAYDLEVINKHKIRFDRCISKSDYDVTLQLYERGYPAYISRMWGHWQCGGMTLPGGSFDYRDNDMHSMASEQLHDLHPKFVRIVEKTRLGWTFPRWDVHVAWSKALRHGTELRIGLDP